MDFGEGGTKKCPHCFSDIDARASVCPNCKKSVKKSNVGRLLVLVIVGSIVVLWILSNIGGRSSSPSTFSPGINTGPEATSRPTNVMVIYTVTGSASSVDLTIENESGNTEQASSVSLPYQKSFRADPGQFVYVSAQNNGESGTVECKITVDGRTLETASSSGAYVIASCSGSAN